MTPKVYLPDAFHGIEFEATCTDRILAGPLLASFEVPQMIRIKSARQVKDFTTWGDYLLMLAQVKW